MDSLKSDSVSKIVVMTKVTKLRDETALHWTPGEGMELSPEPQLVEFLQRANASKSEVMPGKWVMRCPDEMNAIGLALAADSTSPRMHVAGSAHIPVKVSSKADVPMACGTAYQPNGALPGDAPPIRSVDSMSEEELKVALIKARIKSARGKRGESTAGTLQERSGKDDSDELHKPIRAPRCID